MQKGLRERLINIIAKSDYLFFLIKYWRIRIIMFLSRFTTDEAYIRRQYRNRTGKHLNLEKPELYNEKVQYTKLFCHDSRMKKLADKYEVREYVKEKIGEKYLTKLYGLYNTVEEIPFERLPEQFAVKLTNGSGYNIICEKKTPKMVKTIQKRFRKWLKVDFYKLGREWAYKDVKNRIICEEYIAGDGAYGLNDYKVFCFGGVPKMIQVDYARFTGHKRNLYTPQWEFINEKVAYENDPNADIPKPENLQEMLDCAAALSKDFAHVRVDFYSVRNRLIFGEITFYHGAGYLHYEHEEYERELGSYWELGDEISTTSSNDASNR